jgi:transcription factor 4/12
VYHSWQQGAPLPYTALPPPARYLPVPELDDALNVLQNHAVISGPPVVAHKSSGKRKFDEFKSESEDGEPTSSGSARRRSRGPSEGEEDPASDSKDRRWANNQRERVRIRDINEALKELGRICASHQRSDKPVTKLGLLNNAVDVIMTLEQQVRERNLNPKVACVQRQEPQAPSHHSPIPGLGSPSLYPAGEASLPGS